MFVIRVAEPATVVALFKRLGLDFVEEQHEVGPAHYACQRGDDVFEVYPALSHTSAKFITP